MILNKAIVNRKSKKTVRSMRLLAIDGAAETKKDVISPGKARTFNLLMCNQAGMRITVRRASQLRHGGIVGREACGALL